MYGIGISLPNLLRPVELHAIRKGFPDAPLLRRSVMASRRVAAPALHTSGSSIVNFIALVIFAPTVKTTVSTRLSDEVRRHLDMAARSRMSPSMTFRFGVVDGGKIEVSFDGTRHRAVQLWPAARVCFRAERPTPVLAPKNATVLGEVDILFD